MEEKLKAKKKGMRGTKDTMRREREREGKDKWRFRAGNAKKPRAATEEGSVSKVAMVTVCSRSLGTIVIEVTENVIRYLSLL